MTSTWKLSRTTFHNDSVRYTTIAAACVLIVPGIRSILICEVKKKCLNEFIRFLLLCTNWSLSRWARCHCVHVLSEACGKVCLLLARKPSSGISPVCATVCWITWQSLLHLTMQINFIFPPKNMVLIVSHWKYMHRSFFFIAMDLLHEESFPLGHKSSLIYKRKMKLWKPVLSCRVLKVPFWLTRGGDCGSISVPFCFNYLMIFGNTRLISFFH